MHCKFDWVVAAVVVVAAAVGCQDEQRGGPRIETFPLTGKVLVDGKPEMFVKVACVPQHEDSKFAYGLTALTDKEGAFSISTYESADGLPTGEYKLTFVWMKPGGFMGKSETDRLKGAYADPDKSEWTVTVKQGEKQDMGIIKLKIPE